VTITDPTRPTAVAAPPAPLPPQPPARRGVLVGLGVLVAVLVAATAVTAYRDHRHAAAQLRRLADSFVLESPQPPAVTGALDGRGGVQLQAEVAVGNPGSLPVDLLSAALDTPGWAAVPGLTRLAPDGVGLLVFTRSVPCSALDGLRALQQATVTARARGGTAKQRRLPAFSGDVLPTAQQTCGVYPVGQGLVLGTATTRRVGDALRLTVELSNVTLRAALLRSLASPGATVLGDFPVAFPGRRLGGPPVTRRVTVTVQITDCAAALAPGHDGPGLLVLNNGGPDEQGVLPDGTWRPLVATVIQKRCGSSGNLTYG
jgi:hypothetical protein